mgnify:CR=1 FL=1
MVLYHPYRTSCETNNKKERKFQEISRQRIDYQIKLSHLTLCSSGIRIEINLANKYKYRGIFIFSFVFLKILFRPLIFFLFLKLPR